MATEAVLAAPSVCVVLATFSSKAMTAAILGNLSLRPAEEIAPNNDSGNKASDQIAAISMSQCQGTISVHWPSVEAGRRMT